MSSKPVVKYIIALAAVAIVVVAAVLVVPGLLKPPPVGTRSIVVGSYGGEYDQAFVEVAKSFTAQTGIVVRVVNVGSSLTELPKVLAGDSGMDVWASGEIAIVAAANAGTLVPLDDLPNVQSIPESLKLRINGTAYAIAYDSSALGLVYNSEVIKNPPATWEEYIQMVESGSIKGNVGIMGPERYQAATLIQMALVAGGNEKDPATMEKVWQMLKEMAPHIGYVMHGSGAMVSALTSGDLVAMAPGPIANGYGALQAGAPVYFKVLGGAPALLDNDPVVALKGPNEEAAKEFINYILNPEPNSIMARIVAKFPVNPQATVDQVSVDYLGMTPAELYKIGYNPDWAYVSAQYADWNARWTSDIKPLLTST